VDSVAVKGRHEGVVVHELLSMADVATDDMRRLAKMTFEAFDAYMQVDATAAQQRYEAILALWPDDPVAKLMAQRCREIASAPVPATWDTTFRMKDK
jgi:adenylate cyclase